MYSAIGVEPTKESASTSGFAISASTASLSPCTTLKTPSGRPASQSSSATRIDGPGSRSDGLRTKVLPQAMAIGYIHIGTITGEIERGDTGDHAERLAHAPVVDAAADLF